MHHLTMKKSVLQSVFNSMLPKASSGPTNPVGALIVEKCTY